MMAIGMGKMLGFNFPQQLQFTLISRRTITEFWRRWHITPVQLVPRVRVYPAGRQPQRP